MGDTQEDLKTIEGLLGVEVRWFREWPGFNDPPIPNGSTENHGIGYRPAWSLDNLFACCNDVVIGVYNEGAYRSWHKYDFKTKTWNFTPLTEARLGPDDMRAIMKTKEEILAIWPDAKWFPWDNPPIGVRVQHADYRNFPKWKGTIMGRGYTPVDDTCPTCKQKLPDANKRRNESEMMVQMWLIELDMVDCNGKHIQVLWYPPSLMEVKE